jgi:pyrophosphatase PpaX
MHSVAFTIVILAEMENDMIKAVIFDFDGTIINTNALIEDGLNQFAKKYRGKVLTKQELGHLTGKTLEYQMAYINPEKAESMFMQFRVWYNHHHNEKAHAFPGMFKLIQMLKLQGYRLAIVSNNSKASLDMGLKHLGLQDAFQHVITKDDVDNVKPAPDGLEKAMQLLAVQPYETIYVGDAATDVAAAKNARTKSILVGWTHLDANSITKADPDYLISTAQHLNVVLDSLKYKTERIAI